MATDPIILQKAATLIEALPYIQRFRGKIIVVKYGGAAMTDPELRKQVIQDVVLLKLVGFKPVIVHGGGKEINAWLKKVGKVPNFINGRRVTDAETMEIVEMVLNKVNKDLVSLVNALGVKGIGISGKDGGLIRVEKQLIDGIDYGYVGAIQEVNPKIICDLLDEDYLPVVSPISFNENYESYNLNADDAGCAVASALKAEKLAFMTDVEGVYRDFEDKSSLISEMTVTEAKEFIAGGMAGGGMIPKLQGCIAAINNGVSRVHILDGRVPHCLLLEIYTNKGIGTAILGNNEEKFGR